MSNENALTGTRVLLAGFMDFNAVVNFAINECNLQEFHGYEHLRPKWQHQNQNAKALAQTDPYQVPSDMVKDIDDPALQDTLVMLKERIKLYPQLDILPFDIKLVNLDYLLACQLEVNLGRAEELATTTGVKEKLGMKELLEICVDTKDHEVDVRTQVRGNTVYFSSDDPDVRFRGVSAGKGNLPGRGGTSSSIKAQTFTMYLTLGDPFIIVYRIRASGQAGGPGPVSIQLPQGQGFFQLQVTPGIQAQQQAGQQQGTQHEREFFAPANGYHRMYLLKKAGYSHIPAVIVDLQQDQIQTFFPNNLLGNLMAFVNSPRPPLVKDFLNTALTMTFPGPKWKTYWKASWNLEGPFHA